MIGKYATFIRWGSIAVIVISLMVAMQSLPLQELAEPLENWIDSLGVWGPIVFGLIYIAATICFVPGFVLTVAGGALFGLLWGFVTVSISSVIGASLAFLISRYLARDKIQKMADSNPKFGAIDEAITEGGWKIVGLLRLSPAIPFNLQNYLYGLTKVDFVKYVLVSWVAMAPGTLLYVYVGHVAGLAASGGEAGFAKWALLIVGLLATIGVTFYITKLARSKLAETKAKSDDESNKKSDDSSESEDESNGNTKAIVYLVAAIAVVVLAIVAQFNKEAISGFVQSITGGPPEVEMQEAYESKPGGPMFDHSLLQDVLEKHVSKGGWVDYKKLKQSPKQLNEYITTLAVAPLEKLDRNEKLALLINAYNAFTLKLIVENYPLDSIKDIPAGKRWDDKRWKVGSNTWSLSQIEHEQVRPNFKKPRIHFALVCAAVGCPPLAQEVYQASKLESQLANQTDYVHLHSTWLQLDRQSKTIKLTKLYQWYGNDFEQYAGSVRKYVSEASGDFKSILQSGDEPSIEFLDYNWSLNDIRNKQPR